jgi:putative endonuclease
MSENKKIKNRNKELGDFGEKIARKILIEKGYEIIELNYRTKFGEIDIIAKENNVLIFVEVKTRTNKNFKAIDSITRKKQETMATVANIFISEKSPIYDDLEVRFDLVLIDEGNIEILKNAFII